MGPEPYSETETDNDPELEKLQVDYVEEIETEDEGWDNSDLTEIMTEEELQKETVSARDRFSKTETATVMVMFG